jgi:carbonic anhydrase
MACTTGTSPIDVTTTQNRCDLTCKYRYSYGNSSLSVTNNTDHLTFSYDGLSDVTYNADNYTVQEIRLYKPSLNLYHGSRVDAELIIHHTSITGQNLLVCVPINNSDSSSAASSLFNGIIPYVPSDVGESQSINVADYNLNTFIPQAPYFSYIGSLPYQPCNGNYNIVLFDPAYAINMSSDNMNTVASVITGIAPTIQPVGEGGGLYYNEKGTTQNSGTGEDDIYIKCNALDEDGNIIPDDEDGNGENNIIGRNVDETGEGGFKMTDETRTYLESIGGVVGGVLFIYLAITLFNKFTDRVSAI